MRRALSDKYGDVMDKENKETRLNEWLARLRRIKARRREPAGTVHITWHESIAKWLANPDVDDVVRYYYIDHVQTGDECNEELGN